MANGGDAPETSLYAPPQARRSLVAALRRLPPLASLWTGGQHPGCALAGRASCKQERPREASRFRPMPSSRSTRPQSGPGAPPCTFGPELAPGAVLRATQRLLTARLSTAPPASGRRAPPRLATGALLSTSQATGGATLPPLFPPPRARLPAGGVSIVSADGCTGLLTDPCFGGPWNYAFDSSAPPLSATHPLTHQSSTLPPRQLLLHHASPHATRTHPPARAPRRQLRRLPGLLQLGLLRLLVSGERQHHCRRPQGNHGELPGV